MQREIHGDGKNVCRVNGRPVTVTQLRTLGSRLLNIHGQHDGQQLLDEEQHLLYLDSFGRTEQLLAEYREKYQAMAALRRQMQALEMDETEKARRVDTLTYQLQELERAKLRPGEEEELQSRRTLLHNAEKFISAVSGADFCLNGDDGSDGAANLVRQAQGPWPRCGVWTRSWGSCMTGWRPPTARFTTWRTPSGTSGRISTSLPRSWTGWRDGWTSCTA